MRHICALLLLASLCRLPQVGIAATAPRTDLPHFEQRGAATQLIVDGKPFLVLGGEVKNSSTSNLVHFSRKWPLLVRDNLNTILVPVAWETIEPVEGQFDFSNVDGLIKGARDHDLRLVFLWFGTWKNTFSSYVPSWVKRDTKRFPRMQTADGRGTERISALSTTARDADARAFAQLMRHLKAVDGARQTVLMVQVENEVGVIPESRDHTPNAEAAFAGPVPVELMTYLTAHRATLNPELRAAWEANGGRASGSWTEVFGDEGMTDSLFMSWSYARYIDHVAAAGKAEYALPMFTNAALIRPNYEPGQYNSGGPLPFAMDLWKAGAPAVDFLAPDIYFDNYAYWASQYRRPDNVLFVPEARGGAIGAANALYTFGALKGFGFSPFGIDERGVQLAGDPSVGLGTGGDGDPVIGALYGQLEQLAPLVLEKQAEGKISTVIMEGSAQRSGRGRIGDYMVNMARANGPDGNVDPDSRVAAMFLQTGPDEFIVLGAGDMQVSFTTDRPGPPIVGIESIDEQVLKDGTMSAGRRLNGDENGQGQSLRLSSSDAAENKVYRVRLYRYR